MNITIKFIIDPTKFPQLNMEGIQTYCAVKSFLANHKEVGVWANNEDYLYTYNKIKYKFSFTHALLKRKRKEGREGERYDIYNPLAEPLGKGGYGVVYPILGTLKFEFGKAILKKATCRVVKVQQCIDLDEEAEVKLEYQGLLASGHLHPKPPVFVDNKEYKSSFLVMHLAQGVTLEKIIHPIKRLDIIPNLNVHMRFKITFAILHAIKAQVTDKGLIHRDLKPLNILIDLKKSPIKASIIDYGFYLESGQQDYRTVGTKAYAGFETFVSNPVYSSKIDVYSTGRILSYLWGDNYKNYYMGRDITLEYKRKKSTNKNLFNDPDVAFFLSENDQLKIKKILCQMIADDPQLRPSIDDAIEVFSTINVNKYNVAKKNFDSSSDSPLFKEKLSHQLNNIFIHLNILKKQIRDLKDREFTVAANCMKKLRYDLKIYTRLLAKKPESHILLRYQELCIKKIDKARPILQTHRNSWWLVAEISTAICLLGAGYLVALGVNYLNTNRIGLFSQTKSDRLVEQMKESIIRAPCA